MEARSESLPRQRRLARRSEFTRVYESGRRLFSRYTVLFFTGNDLPHSRLGITATKKLGSAVIRNRMKRWTREIYRRQRPALDLDRCAVDLVVNIKPAAAEATFQQFGEDLVRSLRRLSQECGG